MLEKKCLFVINFDLFYWFFLSVVELSFLSFAVVVKQMVDAVISHIIVLCGKL